MADIIVCLSDEKGALLHIKNLIEQGGFERVILLKPQNLSVPSFSVPDKEILIMSVDLSAQSAEVATQMYDGLKGRVQGFEVGVNMVCGTGKLHMALLSALLKLGLGIRLVILTKEGVREL